MSTDGLTPQQRAALVVVRLCAGEALTIRDVMRMLTGLRQAGAYRLLMILTGIHELPLS